MVLLFEYRVQMKAVQNPEEIAIFNIFGSRQPNAQMPDFNAAQAVRAPPHLHTGTSLVRVEKARVQV